MNGSTHLRTGALLLGVVAALAMAVTPARAVTYYVDASAGNDTSAGTSVTGAWRTLAKVNAAPLQPGDSVLFKRGETWRGQLAPRNGSSAKYITYGAYSTGNKPAILGSVRKNLTSDWVSEGGNIWTTTATFSADIGNLILNGEKLCGVKVASRGELNAQGKFWYNDSTRKVSIYSTSNPASYYSDIECAVTVFIINEAGKSWVIFENLALKYGGSHGIGGSGMSNIIIRDLDISWIGGGRQDASGIRFGNGIEFIGAASNIVVERCRVWECYDAGLTNQNLSATLQSNIRYRNNVVWNCEYSFEYWSNQSGATTRDIYFENNTCAYAGGGWGHAQRPIKSGRHLHFDDNRASTSNFHIRNNIFYQALDNNIYLSPNWNNLSSLVMDYNCWHNSLTGNMAVWQGAYYPMTQFSNWQSRSGKDAHSTTRDPLFVNAGALDFHLSAGSPCINAGYPGSTDPDGSIADLGAFSIATGGGTSDTQAPVITSVVISPNTGWVRAASAIVITVTAANSETGLTPSAAQINGRSVQLAGVGSGRYTGTYTVQSGDAQGINIEATGITLRDAAGNVSAPASSSGSTLKVDTNVPSVASVAISPNTGTVAPGNTVTITVIAFNNEAGLTPSTAQVNGRSVPLAEAGGGRYTGTYTVQTGDTRDVNIEATGITLRDAAGNVSAPASSSGSTLKVAAQTSTSGQTPLISAVTISPNSGWVKTGSTVLITAREATGRTGLSASPARINGKSVPLADRGSGTYSGTYTVQSGDPQGVNIEASGITLSTTSASSSTPIISDAFDTTALSGWTVRGNAAARNGRLEVTADGVEDMALRNLPSDLSEAWCTYRIYVDALSLPAVGDKSAGSGFISPTVSKGAYAGFINRNGATVWRIEYSTDSANVVEAVSTTPVAIDQWHEVTLSYKRASGGNNGEVKLWLNGTLIASASGLDNDTLPARQFALGDRYGVNVRGTYYIDDVRIGSGVPGNGTVLTSAPAASSGSTLRVDTIAPAITSATISPNSGTVYPGNTVSITVNASNGETGLTPSAAGINGKIVPLTDAGSGRYTGIYTVQTGDPQGVNIEASGITLRDAAGNVSAATSSSGSTLRVSASTAVSTPELLSNPSFFANTDGWSVYAASGAIVSTGRDTAVFDTAPAGYRLQCSTNGSAYYNIQLMTTRAIPVIAGKTYTLSFRARSTRNFTMHSIVLMKQSSPWTWYQTASSGTSPVVTTAWQSYSATFTAGTTASDARLTFYLGEALPDGATLSLDTVSLRETSGPMAKAAAWNESGLTAAFPTERVSERCILLGLGNSPDSVQCAPDVRNLTCGRSPEAVSDSTDVRIRSCSMNGMPMAFITGLEPGARYLISLPGRDEMGGPSGRMIHRMFTTLAAFVDDDLDPADPFIVRDEDSLFVADNDPVMTFAWSSWEGLGAVSYRVTVRSHQPEAVVSLQTVSGASFGFTGEAGQTYSLEIRPLDADGTELGVISSRKIRCAPGPIGTPGNPVFQTLKPE